jgi:soluble cytochrome b562
MENPLLSALQSNYGDGDPPAPDTNTVRGLLAFCKLWLEGETETEELNNPCMSMSGRLKGGAKDTEADLRQNPDLVDSARRPIERMAQGYFRIAEVLDRLPTLAADNDTDGYKEAIEIFDEERQAVLDSNAEIERSMSGETRMCPRCGGQEGDFCDRCNVITLFPDPRATEYDLTKTAVLAPMYGMVNRAYDAVMSGKESLPHLLQAVEQLDAALVEMQKAYEEAANMEGADDDDAPEFKDGKELANRLLDELDKSFAAIDRIRDVEESFRMADLSRGWDTIFDSAVAIQRASQRYAKSYGHMEDAIDESDSVNFSGE